MALVGDGGTDQTLRILNENEVNAREPLADLAQSSEELSRLRSRKCAEEWPEVVDREGGVVAQRGQQLDGLT